MERKTMTGLGTAAAVAVGASTISFDGITIPANITEISGWSVVVLLFIFVIFALVKGWVIVKIHYDTILARAEAAERANERLSERAAILTDTNSVQARTIEQNAAVGDTVTKLVHAIQEARIGPGGAP